MSEIAHPLAGRAAMQRWATRIFTIAAILLFCVSPMALGVIGFNYDGAGGAMWQKLHPATYAAALAFALDIASKPAPMAFIKELPARFPGAALFFISWVLTIVYAVLVQHLPVTSLIETYFIALIALLIADDLGPETHLFLRRFIHVVLFANAVIGVIEFVTHWRLFPYVLSGEELTYDYRSTALLGHPLLNAGITGAYALCLFLGADKSLPPLARVIMICVQILGLAAFGGRTSMLMCGLIMGGVLVKDFALILLGKRFDLGRLLGTIFFVPVIIGGAAYAIYAGIFDDLIARFVDDNGSAEARVTMMRMFDAFDLTDLLLGPSPEAVTSTQRSLGIAVAIENTWIALMFAYGIIMSSLFIIGLLALFWEIWRRSARGATLLLVFFIVVISSAVGLASKTMKLNQFTLVMLFVFPGEARPSPARSGPRES
jgi:hypothetical protein